MGALGDNAGILFRIKADSSQANTELAAFTSKLIGGSKEAEAALAGLSTGALVGVAAVAAVGAAAIAASAALFKFTKDAAEFGSAMYDASVRTGLSAASISALKLAADSSGSSLETVSGSVAKLNVLVGQAANGNEKAQKTLAAYGITATDTNEAFNQAVKVIGSMTDQGQKAAAMMALFKDKTGQVSGVIDQVNGDFAAYIETAKRLGVVLSEQDLKASDDFGDSLEVLGAQAKATGVKFATELMPLCIQAMNAISQVVANNKDVVRDWGDDVADVIRGVGVVFTNLPTIIGGALFSFERMLDANNNKIASWVARAIADMNPLIVAWRALAQLGADANRASAPVVDLANRNNVEFDTVTGTLRQRTVQPKKGFVPSFGGGGGGGGGGGSKGGGGGGGNTALQDAQTAMRQRLAILKAGDAEELALLDQMLKAKQLREQDYLTAVTDLKQKAIQDEINEYQKLLDTQKLKAKERIEIENKIKVLQIEKTTEATKGETKLAELKAKNAEAERKSAEAAEKFDKEADQRRFENWMRLRDKKRAAVLKDAEEQAQLKRDQIAGQPNTSGDNDYDPGSFLGGLNSGALIKLQTNLNNTINIVGTLKNTMGAMVKGMAEGIGSMVQQWVLYGTAGPNALRKMTAALLANLAAQAAVEAIMELARGFAALANPFLAWTAPFHFHAAALFGVIAGVAAGAGRAVAGNVFQQQTAGGGQAAQGQQGQQNNNFGGQFHGFQHRANVVLGGVEEALTQFTRTFGVVPPHHVVMAGADGASSAIFDAHTSVLERGGQATESFVRATGRYR